MKLIIKNKKVVKENKKPFRFRIVERKLINEQTQSDMIVEMLPSTYLKLTCPQNDYQALRNVADSDNYRDLLGDTLEDRKKSMLEFGIDESTQTARILLLGALNFIKPASDSKSSLGLFDESKAGIVNLTINTSDGKVVNHEGRNRTLVRWLTKPTTPVKVKITQQGENKLPNWKHFPTVIQSQFDNTRVARDEAKQVLDTDGAKSDKYILLDIDKYSTGYEARTGSKVFDKLYVGIFKMKYPARLFYKLKQGAKPVLPANKSELNRNYELVRDPKSELGVDSATGGTMDNLIAHMPEQFEPL
jgi:hypothetical protein